MKDTHSENDKQAAGCIVTCLLATLAVAPAGVGLVAYGDAGSGVRALGLALLVLATLLAAGGVLVFSAAICTKTAEKAKGDGA